jgi:isopenicillin N synthase-like dioxygenase
LTHPAIIQDVLPEIKDFEHVCPLTTSVLNALLTNCLQALHTKVLARLYELIAIGLGVPPQSLTQIHDYNAGACGILRYMRYSPYTEEELPKLTTQLYGSGHTDSCAITLLFRQPIAALQIKDPKSGAWKWAKPMDNSLTVNAGDVLSILTGNYIKSTIHRVSIVSVYRETQALTFLGEHPTKGSTHV